MTRFMTNLYWAADLEMVHDAAAALIDYFVD